MKIHTNSSTLVTYRVVIRLDYLKQDITTYIVTKTSVSYIIGDFEFLCAAQSNTQRFLFKI